MTLAQYIDTTLKNISEIQNLVGNDNIYAFISETNPSKCFIRWSIISEEPIVQNVDKATNLYKAEIQISVFANTIGNADFISKQVINAFNNDNINDNDIRSSRTTTIQPIVEDKFTIHYPIRATIYFNN